jgi:hypothetical protein
VQAKLSNKVLHNSCITPPDNTISPEGAPTTLVLKQSTPWLTFPPSSKTAGLKRGRNDRKRGYRKVKEENAEAMLMLQWMKEMSTFFFQGLGSGVCCPWFHVAAPVRMIESVRRRSCFETAAVFALRMVASMPSTISLLIRKSP